jgi:hypothetical protein
MRNIGLCQNNLFVYLAIFSCTCATHSHTAIMLAMQMIYSTIPLHLTSHNMPRVTRASEQTARWNLSDTTKFQELVDKGKIDINNITPVFIEAIRKKHGWENCSHSNFRDNYRKVANTLRLAQDLNGARALKGESCVEFVCFSHIFY